MTKAATPQTIIDLSGQERFFGCLVPCKTGVLWTNQVGGIANVHPEVEGFFVPLPSCWEPPGNPLESISSCDMPYDAEFQSMVTMFLSFVPLHFLFRPLDVDEFRRFCDCVGNNAIAEAWVPVRVLDFDCADLAAHPYCDILEPLRGRDVILVYGNCD